MRENDPTISYLQIRDAIERGQSGQLLPTAASEKEADEEEGGGQRDFSVPLRFSTQNLVELKPNKVKIKRRPD